MNRVFFVCMIAALLYPEAGFAEKQASSDIKVSARARKIFHISGSGTPWSVKSADMLDGSTGKIRSGITQTVEITGVLCNYYGARYTITSVNGALTAGASTAEVSGFQNRLLYRATAVWAGGQPASSVLQANGASSNTKISGVLARPITNGTIFVQFEVPPGDNPLPVLSGNYSDTVNVKIEPNF
jgi:hypothetical protein